MQGPMSFPLKFLVFSCVWTGAYTTCTCKDEATTCVVNSKMSMNGRIQALHENGTQLELALVVLVEGLQSPNYKYYDLMRNDSSLTIDWLPMPHDVVKPSRRPPILKNLQIVDVGNQTMGIVVELLFDVLNMKLRSTYEIRISSIYDRECRRMVPLTSEAALNVTFACERILNVDCIDSVKVDHHPVCNLMRNYHTRIVEVNRSKELDVLVSIQKHSHKKIKYFVAYYGNCEESSTRSGECVLDLQQSRMARFCPPNKTNCSHGRFYNITIAPLTEGRYGIQVCGVVDKRFELPPLIGTASRKIVADQLYLSSAAASSLTVPLVGSPNSLMRTLIGYTIVLAVLFITLLLLLAYKCATGKSCCCRRKKQRDAYVMDEDSVVVFDDKVLGSGRFGIVCIGQLSSDWHGAVILDDMQRVAVKRTRSSEKQKRREFFDEIEGAKFVGRHPRIISFIGTVIKSTGLLHVMEYCANGNLSDYLTLRRNYMVSLQQRGIDLNGGLASLDGVEFDDVVSVQDLHRLAGQICAGMVFLASKGVVHNALAARHVLVTADHSAKISDFGFISTPNSPNSQPAAQMEKWTALEVLRRECSTPSSDVWSFGVVLWELFTMGGQPYYNVADEAVRELVEKGFRLQKPDQCQLSLYQMMRECWSDSPSGRPSFASISTRLSQLVQNEPPQAFHFVSISTTCDYYADVSTFRKRPSADVVGLPPDAAALISESERLLGYRR